MACDKVDDVFLSELEGGSVTVELLLGMEWVHGDLSPYNMLYHDGRIVLIDFPQGSRRQQQAPRPPPLGTRY